MSTPMEASCRAARCAAWQVAADCHASSRIMPMTLSARNRIRRPPAVGGRARQTGAEHAARADIVPIG
jgi:hypothetical protein